MADERKLSEVYRQFLKKGIAERAERLRSLAEDLDRYAGDIDRVPAPGVPRFAAVVGSVQHDVLWGVANLNVDNLTSLAADGDEARAEEERGEH